MCCPAKKNRQENEAKDEDMARMEINEVATLKVRELPAAADRKGSSGERGERGQNQVKFITPLSRSQYLIISSGVSKRKRKGQRQPS